MALLTYLRQEDERRAERDWQSLRTRLLVHGVRPEQIPEILEALEGQKQKDELGIEEHAPELTDEEMESYVPLSAQETGAAIENLRRFGVAIQDIPS